MDCVGRNIGKNKAAFPKSWLPKMRAFGFIFLLLAMCAPAMALPRDDAMVGAYRCANIESSRIWLDCFYGAAQPVRVALGLPPAPADQVQLSASLHAGAAIENLPVRNQVMATAGQCSAIQEERQWLNCYYAAANPLRSALGLSQGPAMPAQSAKPINKAPPRLSTFEKILGIANVSVVSRMSNYSFDQSSKFTVTLENGQVWRQSPGDDSVAHWKGASARYVVSITGGAFGTYNLSVKDHAGKYKVRRISGPQ
jgi:hypothetical protein